ncbi:MAG TPA: succinate dehydrogenase assembly factor 2 [Steroidobacteraceae bacterium]|nr:succinate dehydrogenase assembly factor 2 [Steroidobacteraceae bacterium]
MSTAMEIAGKGGAAPEAAERRLRWRCRRGMKELDVLLERYGTLRLPHAPPAERQAFARLLGMTDPLLAAYLLGADTAADPALAQLVARIRALCRSAP